MKSLYSPYITYNYFLFINLCLRLNFTIHLMTTYYLLKYLPHIKCLLDHVFVSLASVRQYYINFTRLSLLYNITGSLSHMF